MIFLLVCVPHIWSTCVPRERNGGCLVSNVLDSLRRETATLPCVSRLGMKITGHTYCVTIRSQRNVSGSRCLAQYGHYVLPILSANSSSYLNRPIVGPTPLKLPAPIAAISNIIAFFRFHGMLLQHTTFFSQSQELLEKFF